MQYGVSTACFYPEETAASLQRLQRAGIKTVELFLNTFRELEPAYLARLEGILQAGDMCAAALHPFTSALETFLFAADYPTRLEDGLKFYEQYFSACRRLGIPRAVFHGMSAERAYPLQRYCDHYLRLRELARRYDVDFLHENVVRCFCGRPEHILEMRRCTREDIGFVLDVKQMRRSGVSLSEMLDAMGPRIRHIHLSDFTEQCDCTVPGTGREDFSALSRHLHRIDYSGAIIIELYREGFDTMNDLLAGLRRIETLF